jgi:tetratricopeptide (TPR) repeat protein
VRTLVPSLLLLGACAATVPPAVPPRPAPAAEWVRTGDRLRRQGRLTEAEAAYRGALDVDAHEVRAHVGLQTLGERQGRQLELRRRYREAGDPFLRARLEPESREPREILLEAAEPWRSFGLASLEAGQRGGSASRARDDYSRALTVDPGHTWARLGRARVWLARGDVGAAEADFRAALWGEPEHPLPCLGMSAIADRRGDLSAAFRWATEAYRRAPADETLAGRVHALAVRGGSKAYLRRAAEELEGQGAHGEGIGLLLASTLWARLGEGERAQAALEEARARGATEKEVETARRRRLSPGMRGFVTTFTAAVRARYRHYRATREAEGFAAFVMWARDLFERTTGRTLGPRVEPLEFAFVGTLVDPTAEAEEPLVRACAEEGLLLVLGQRRGGPPEALLAEIVRREPMRAVRVRGTEVEREEIRVGWRYLSGYQEWGGGGDLAGLALARCTIIDLHAVARWEGDLERRLRRLEPHRAALLAAPALKDEPVTAVDDPAGVAERLYLAGDFDLAAEVAIHEDSHLVDAARHLPVGSHAFRNLGLALRRGFSADEILAFLERNAQLTAIAEGPAPLAALASCCAVLGGPGVHAKAYSEIVEAIVAEIHAHPEQYPEIDPGRVIVQQLHRLPEAKVRALGRILVEQWDLLE